MSDRRMLHHVIDGSPVGDPGARTLILGPSLGTSLHLWDGVVARLVRDRTLIRYDHPGHGDTPGDVLTDRSGGVTTVADLAGLVLELADQLGLDRFDYAGVSLGGAIGSWLAVHHPDRIARLALVCSSARFGEPAAWHDRAKLVRAEGTGPVADTAAGRWFAPAFAAGPDPMVARLVQDLRAASPAGYAACCDALAGFDLRSELASIAAPTLVVAGRKDLAAPLPHARELADGIAGADLIELADTGHLAPAERPGSVAAALSQHFADHADHEARYADGLRVRRDVLGDAHVDRAIANTTAFTADFQDFITRYAWGEIWTRPGLDRRVRSVVTLTALIARGSTEELAMHVRGAITNGLTVGEIGEVLMQSAVYCGVPSANSAFAVAQRVLAELDQSGQADLMDQPNRPDRTDQ
jgi:3-oxoadipate enol-lactonase / 4-carboxymuconolactone decarboxylase